MKLLAVDTSCDESCAAIVDTETWTLDAEVVHSHIDAMAAYGGVVPEIASREHLRGLPLATHQALEKAGCTLKDIDWYCATNRPGLVGALLVGVSFTKAAAFAEGKPWTALNHIEAHLYSPLLCTLEKTEGPAFPWIALVVSGGHTELFRVDGIGKYQWLGGTIDDAAGEAFDKTGKLLGLPYPSGPFIDKWVREKGTERRGVYQFPRSKVKPFHFSFSGLKTSIATQVSKMGDLSEDDKLNVVSSAQEAILEPLVTQVRGASEDLGIPNIVVTGGVACNSRLRALLPEAYFPPPRHCTDNAAMVALLGALKYREGLLKSDPWNTTALPYLDFEPAPLEAN